MDEAHKNVNYDLLVENDQSTRSSNSPPPPPPSSHVITFDNHRSPRRPSSRHRLIQRSNGRPCMKYKHLPATGWLGFIRDGFTTILNARWYVLIILFSALYCLSWLFFGLTWWGTDAAYLAASNESCVPSLDGFSSAFLFSLETQVTIGYGHRYITQNCSFGIILLIIQCITGLFLDSFLLGLIFTKITRPRNRRKTILFSNQACITTRNGQNYFEFRIADARKTSSLVEAHVRLQLYWYKKDSSGGNVLHQADMEVGYDDGTDRVILLTPVIVSHCITETSPLYTLTAENLLSHDIEVVVVLEGIVESTGLTAQALWSYTEEEIMYGYQFVPMTSRNRDEVWEVDFSLLSHVIPYLADSNNDDHII